MKKFISFLLCCALLICSFPAVLAANTEDPIEVYVNDARVACWVSPKISGNEIFVQMRPVFEKMGFNLNWISVDKKVIATAKSQTIYLKIGNIFVANDWEYFAELPAAAYIAEGCTMVPLSLINKIYGFQATLNKDAGRIDVKNTSQTNENSANNKEGIVADLQTLKAEMINNNLMSNTRPYGFPKELIPPKDWINRMDALIANVPTMTLKEIQYTLLKLLNDMGDPNTSIIDFGTPFQPLSFERMSDGVYLKDAASEFDNVVGKKLTAINGLPIDKVIEKLEPLLPTLNEGWREYSICKMLASGGYLYLLGIIDTQNQSYSYTFGEETVTTFNKNLSAYGGYVSDLDSAPVKFPFCYEMYPRRNYVQVLPEEQAVYAMLTFCADTEGYSLQDFMDEITAAAKKETVKTLILDLRQNQGGSSDFIPLQLCKAIKQISKFTEPGGFYILSGRDTNEIGVAGIFFLQNCNPVIVGQPSRWNRCYTGRKSVALPHMRLVANLSQFYFEMSNEKTLTEPSITVIPTADGFFAGRDEYIEAAITDRGEKANK